jgi:hypothetical protein
VEARRGRGHADSVTMGTMERESWPMLQFGDCVGENTLADCRIAMVLHSESKPSRWRFRSTPSTRVPSAERTP